MRKSLEVWPVFSFEVITGSLHDCTFRVTKTGRNIVHGKTARTEQTLKKYPIELFSEFIVVKLLDLDDVNLALRLAMVERIDPIVEYEFYPDDDNDDSGKYIRKKRPRVVKELYQLF